jgi:hypothetical protein
MPMHLMSDMNSLVVFTSFVSLLIFREAQRGCTTMIPLG